METANDFELRLIRKGEEIPSDILKNFPFWISSDEMDTDPCCWPDAEPPEGGGELVGDERWAQFPENFSRQLLLFGEDEIEIWTHDLIEISQKQDGVLFLVEGFNEIDRDDYDFPAYPSVQIHLRFKSELSRMAAIKDIRRLIREANNEQQDNELLFVGQYPETIS